MLWSDSPHPTSSTGKAVSSATCIRNCVAVRCNFARNFHAWGRGQICKQIAAIRFAYATAPSVLDLQANRGDTLRVYVRPFGFRFAKQIDVATLRVCVRPFGFRFASKKKGGRFTLRLNLFTLFNCVLKLCNGHTRDIVLKYRQICIDFNI